MSLVRQFFSYWTLPEVKSIDIDSSESISIHKNIILSKTILKYVYDSWYQDLLSSTQATKPLSHPVIELGCGASYLEHFIPEIIKTDVVKHTNVTQVVHAESLPFQNQSLRGIVMVNVLHHMKAPRLFFSEALRTLCPGGRLVMIEPSGSPINKFIFNHCHLSEYWDDSITEWKNDSTERLSSANNAIPSIIFERDRKEFEKSYPQLKIIKIKYHTLLSNIVSGGLSYRPLIPSFCLPLIQLFEFLSKPIQPLFGTMMTIEIEKKIP